MRTSVRASERVNESFQMQTYSPTDTHLPMISLENEMQDDDDDDGDEGGGKKDNEEFRIFQSFFWR